MAHIDQEYNTLCNTVIHRGFRYFDYSRAGIEMIQIPTYTLDIDITRGFPLLTTKKIYWKTIAHELIWMLSGSTNINYLMENGVKIWDKDAFNYSGGADVGRIYGAQWKFWTSYAGGPVDQIKKLLSGLKSDFYNRRHLVTAWNPAELNQMALPPCHWSFEIIPCEPAFKPWDQEAKPGFLLKWHQRSCDTFLGIPFDIGLYAMLGKLIEKETGYTFLRLVGDLSNVHFYEPHLALAKSQMERKVFNNECELYIAPECTFDNLDINHFSITNYISHSPIRAEMFAKVKA